MTCPSCLAQSFDVRFPPHVFVCPQCGVVFAHTGGSWTLLEGAPEDAVKKSPISLPARGQIREVEYTVVGVAVRFYWMSADDRQPYFEPYQIFRYEYVLESDTGDVRVLSWDNGQWWMAGFVDPQQVTKRGFRHYEFAGRLYQSYSSVSSSVSEAGGFFPYPVNRASGHMSIQEFVHENRVVTIRSEPKLATGQPYPNCWRSWPGWVEGSQLILEGQACATDEISKAFQLDRQQWKSVPWRRIPSTPVELPRKPLQKWQKGVAGVLIAGALGLLPLLWQPAASAIFESTVICPALFAPKLSRGIQTMAFETKRENGVVRFETEMKQGAVTLHLALTGAGTATESVFIDQKPEFVAGRQPSKRLDWKPGLFPAGQHQLAVRCEAVSILQPQLPVRIQVLDGVVPRPIWAALASALLFSAAMAVLLWRETLP